jgi:uncharacterized protein (UPF0305 family)
MNGKIVQMIFFKITVNNNVIKCSVQNCNDIEASEHETDTHLQDIEEFKKYSEINDNAYFKIFEKMTFQIIHLM